MGGAIGQVRFTPSYSQTVYMQRAHEHTRTGNRSESGLGAYNMHTITCTPSHAHHPVHTIPFTAHPLYSTCHRQHGRRNWSGAIPPLAFTLYHSPYNLHPIECPPPPPPFTPSHSQRIPFTAHVTNSAIGQVPFTETKKHSPNTGARANNTLQVTRPPHRGAC